MTAIYIAVQSLHFTNWMSRYFLYSRGRGSFCHFGRNVMLR